MPANDEHDARTRWKGKMYLTPFSPLTSFPFKSKNPASF